MQERLAFISMQYTWNIHISANANEFLHEAFFAEIVAIIFEVFKQAIWRNAWLSFPCNIPGIFTLVQMQRNVLMQIAL